MPTIRLKLLTPLTNDTNAVGSLIFNNQVAQQEFIQQMSEQHTRMNEMVNQTYHQLMNRPIRDVYMEDIIGDVVDVRSFTTDAIDQVNRTVAIIDGYEKQNSEPLKSDGTEREQIHNDFIAFSSLLARNYNNFYFVQFAMNVGFPRLFKAYRERIDDKNLVSFFIRVANCKDLTAQYLFKAKNYIKHHIVAAGGCEEFLRETYNTISEMLNTIKIQNFSTQSIMLIIV